MATDDKGYTETVTHVRIYSTEAGEWVIDAADDNGKYTEACLTFNSFELVVSAIPTFMLMLEKEGILWVSREGR